MINRNELEAEILAQAARSDEIRQGLNDFGKEVVEYWRSVSPVRTGGYAASVRVLRKFVVNGLPGVRVGSTSRRAALIEFGTGVDTKGNSPRYVPDLGVQVTSETPTPAFAPRAKTVAHFGGDEKRVQEVNEIVQAQNESIAFGRPLNRDRFKSALGDA